MSYLVPISLLFYLVVMVVIGILPGMNLHPMHYFFMGAAFFTFHILFTYLVDLMVVWLAFVIAAGVSVVLIWSYVSRVKDLKFALLPSGVVHLLFLCVFSYAFFFAGYTGLAVTAGAVITLAVVMHVTAGIDWATVFSDSGPDAADSTDPEPDAANSADSDPGITDSTDPESDAVDASDPEPNVVDAADPEPGLADSTDP